MTQSFSGKKHFYLKIFIFLIVIKLYVAEVITELPIFFATIFGNQMKLSFLYLKSEGRDCWYSFLSCIKWFNKCWATDCIYVLGKPLKIELEIVVSDVLNLDDNTMVSINCDDSRCMKTPDTIFDLLSTVFPAQCNYLCCSYLRCRY